MVLVVEPSETAIFPWETPWPPNRPDSRVPLVTLGLQIDAPLDRIGDRPEDLAPIEVRVDQLSDVAVGRQPVLVAVVADDVAALDREGLRRRVRAGEQVAAVEVLVSAGDNLLNRLLDLVATDCRWSSVAVVPITPSAAARTSVIKPEIVDIVESVWPRNDWFVVRLLWACDLRARSCCKPTTRIAAAGASLGNWNFCPVLNWFSKRSMSAWSP